MRNCVRFALGADELIIEKIVKGGRAIALVTGDEKAVTDVRSALDMAMSAKYELHTDKIIVDKRLITEDFFVLSTGLAGEILQKFVNYGVRVAIFGDFSKYTSKPLLDFIYESNKGRDAFFVTSKDAAAEKLISIA